MNPALLEPGIFLHPRPKKNVLSSQPNKRRKVEHKIEEISFDNDARADYLTGFHKRKVQRTKRAQEEAAKKEREEREEMRKQVSLLGFLWDSSWWFGDIYGRELEYTESSVERTILGYGNYSWSCYCRFVLGKKSLGLEIDYSTFTPQSNTSHSLPTQLLTPLLLD